MRRRGAEARRRLGVEEEEKGWKEVSIDQEEMKGRRGGHETRRQVREMQEVRI